MKHTSLIYSFLMLFVFSVLPLRSETGKESESFDNFIFQDKIKDHRGFSSEERLLLSEKMGRMADFFKSNGIIGSSEQVLVKGMYDCYPPATESVVSCDFIIIFYDLKKNGDGEFIPEKTGMSFEVKINTLREVISELRHDIRDSDDEFFLVPDILETKPEYKRYSNGLLVYKNNNNPMWHSITQERYLKALIESGRKDLEKMPRSQANEAARKILLERLNSLRIELLNLSDDQKKSPAYIAFYSSGIPERPSSLVSNPYNLPPNAVARQIGVLNRKFYDGKKASFDFQLISIRGLYSASLVEYEYSLGGSAKKPSSDLLLRMRKEINWSDFVMFLK